MLRATLAALTLSLAAAPALAADNGFYLGVGLGQAGVQLDQDALGEDFDGDDTGYKAIVGFRPLDFLAFEANYVDLGTAEDDVGGLPAEIDATGIDAFVVGILPVALVDLYAKLGYIFWDADVSALGASVSDDGEDLAYGVGVGLHFGSLGARLEYERFDIEDSDTVDMISLGLTWTFL
jgi:hypothetical protein